MIRGLVVCLGATIICYISRLTQAHPTCYYDSRPPDPDGVLAFCPQSADGACCNDVEETTSIELYNSVADGITTDDCAAYYRQVACGPCDAYAGHLYERLGGELGLDDGMTMKTEFCEGYVEACTGQINFPTYEGLTFCEKHVGPTGDQLWSYPVDPQVSPPIGLAKAFPELPDDQLPSRLLCMKITPNGDEWWLSGQDGQFVKINADNPTDSELILDISTGMDFLSSLEEGLLHFAFNPAFNTNGYFYASYSIRDKEGSKNRLARFTYEDSPALTKGSVEVLLTTITRATSIHAAGWCGFKPSDYSNPSESSHELYWSNGDGGPQEDFYNRGPDLTNLHATISRISVPSEPGASGYTIPPGNREGGLPEICANGLRNSFQCGFDSETDELYCGDVGQIRLEEINLIECGQDYGWGRFEGSRCQTALEDRFGDCLDADREGFTFPIFEYCHRDYEPSSANEDNYLGGKDVCGTRTVVGLAVVGGHIYRGQRYNDVLYGALLFADYQLDNIYYLVKEAGEWTPGTIISDGTAKIVSFAEDSNGEVYVISSERIPYQLPCGDLCSTTCLAQTEAIPSFKSLGCFNNPKRDRTLRLQQSPTCPDGEDFMSPEVCGSYCATIEGAAYFGVEFSFQCFCGGEDEDFSRNGQIDMEQCGSICRGAADQLCGGDQAIEIFSFEAGTPAPIMPVESIPPVPPSPTVSPVVVTPAPLYTTQFTYVGCFADVVTARALTGKFSTSIYMTAKVCAGFCTGSDYFGIENGQECYCSAGSDEIDVYGEGVCDVTCAGDLAATCGGYSSLAVYAYGISSPVSTPTSTSYEPLGCFEDNRKYRLLESVFASDSMTTEVCESKCRGSTYFGTEYGQECWCGSPSSIDGAPSTSCTHSCLGDPAQICGGAFAMNLYAYNVASSYVGCYVDSPERVMTPQPEDSSMTLELCANSCMDYTYYGVENGIECHCSNSASFAALGESGRCTSPCAGDASQTCGGRWAISVYTTAYTQASYVGCFLDNEDRVMTLKFIDSSMTVEMCAEACQDFSYFGIEYGRECYCSESTTYTTLGKAANCNVGCGGDESTTCGGFFSISVFKQ